MAAKQEEKMEESTEEIKQTDANPPSLQYRYVCIACTGNAYYTSEIRDVHVKGICENCGATLPSVDKNNFILLTEDQKRAVNQLN